jgi:hypothetical protein
VNEDHPTELRLVHFSGAIRGHLPLMPAGDAQLENPQEPYGEQ